MQQFVNNSADDYDYDRSSVTVRSECNDGDKAISASVRIPNNNHAETVRSEKDGGAWEVFVRYDPNWGVDTPTVTAICVQ